MKRFAPIALVALVRARVLQRAAAARRRPARARRDRHRGRDLRREPRLRHAVRPVSRAPTASPASIRARSARYVPQVDRDGAPLATLPPAWGGLIGAQPAAHGQRGADARAWRTGRSCSTARTRSAARGVVVPVDVMTRNLVHRYYNNIMQINGGTNDGFAAWSDAGGLTMGYYDGSAPGDVAGRAPLHARRQLLHGRVRRLVPEPPVPRLRLRSRVSRPDDRSPAKDLISAVETDSRGRVRLVAGDGAASSALGGAPRYRRDGDLTPKDERGMFHAVNTMQPAYQPSGEAPAAGGDPRYGDPAAAHTLPPQTRRDDRRPARRQRGLVGLVRRRLEGGERRHAGRARHHLQGRGPLPAAPSAVQLLRVVRPGDARRLPRRAPQGLRQRVPRRRRRRRGCPRSRSTSRRATSTSIRGRARSRSATPTSPASSPRSRRARSSRAC